MVKDQEVGDKTNGEDEEEDWVVLFKRVENESGIGKFMSEGGGRLVDWVTITFVFFSHSLSFCLNHNFSVITFLCNNSFLIYIYIYIYIYVNLCLKL